MFQSLSDNWIFQLITFPKTQHKSLDKPKVIQYSQHNVSKRSHIATVYFRFTLVYSKQSNCGNLPPHSQFFLPLSLLLRIFIDDLLLPWSPYLIFTFFAFTRRLLHFMVAFSNHVCCTLKLNKNHPAEN